MTRRAGDLSALYAKLFGVGTAILLMVWLVLEDRHQRALVANGHCRKIAEALYTPPPSGHTSCWGQGTSRHCTTRFHQPDPYLRSLWRCTEPGADGVKTEFWRRSAEETLND